MAVILNIETSSKYASVALSKDGRVIFSKTDDKEMNHAVSLAPFAEEAMKELESTGEKLDAVAVSLGPGSYTGLRIGLSLAKGLAFSLGIKLIGIDTLELLAVKAMFADKDWEGDELIVPMVDARRMEVYTTCFNSALKNLISASPLILDSESFKELADKRKVIFIGDGAEKFKELYSGKNGLWMENSLPNALDMAIPAEKSFLEDSFLGLAYSVPNYMKEFQAGISKVKGLE